MRQLAWITGILTFFLLTETTGSWAQCPTVTVTDSLIFNSCVSATAEFICHIPGNTKPPLANCHWVFTPTDSADAISTFFTYPTCVTYPVTATYTSPGCPDQNFTLQVVVHCKPSPCFTISPTSGCPPLKVCFNASCTTGGVPPYNITWDFGDGSPVSNLDSVCHTYSFNTQCFHPILEVKDSKGCETDTTVADSICTIPPPVPCFSTVGPASNCSAPFTVCYSSSCSTPSTNLTYSWKFGTTNVTPSTSALAAPCVTYAADGSYNVSLTETDASGCSGSITMNGYVNIGNSSTSFTITSDSICTNDSSFIASAASASTYSWICPGANVVSPNAQTTAIYFPITTTSTNYTITLTVTIQPGGCILTQTKTVTVSPVPNPSFTAPPNSSCKPPLDITVTNKTPNPGSWTYQWNFGGGVPTPNPPPVKNAFSVAYTSCGIYGITLTATGSAGCSKTYTVPIVATINCPTGSFSDSLPLVTCAPITVKFVAQPDGNPANYTYKWDFNDTTAKGNFTGGTTADSVISNTYTKVGCNNVALIITNKLGCTDTIVQRGIVCAGALFKQKLDFIATPDTACATKLITFSVVTPVPDNACLTQYHWYFGDGETATVDSPGVTTHTYTDTGCFDVRLVRCNCTCCDTLIKKGYVCISPPIVKLNVARTCQNPFCIICDSKGSAGIDSFVWVIPPQGTPTYYKNKAGKDSAVTICFDTANRTYQVSLTGYNVKAKCSEMLSQTIRTIKPIPYFRFLDSVICVNVPMAVIDSSQGAANYNWYLYDASGNLILHSIQACFTEPGCPGYYLFSKPGNYCLILTVSDVGGCVSPPLTKCIRVNGLNTGFEAISKSVGCPPLTVTFMDTTENNAFSTYVSSTWNFGDPSSGALDSTKTTSRTTTVSHKYNNPGFYTVTLCDKDNHGCILCTSIPMYVNVSLPDVKFYPVDTTACKGSNFCFKDTSKGEGLTYQWYLYNPNGSPGATADTTNACFDLNAFGTFHVKLIATDTLGCRDSTTESVTVGKVSANFIALDTFKLCPYLTDTFVNRSSIPDTNGVRYYWSFGDNTPVISSNKDTLIHTYNRAGNFTVTLIVVTGNGCTDTLIKSSYVKIGGPVANIQILPDSGCAPLTVLFHIVSSTSTHYIWLFGTGASENSLGDTSYTYTSAGVWTPSVFLFDSTCSYSLALNNVYLDSLKTEFSMSQLNLCTSGTITFKDTSYSTLHSADSTAWPILCSWSFGDGTTSNNCDVSHFYADTGTYQVTLTTTTIAGCSNSLTKTIVVLPSPVAAAVSSSKGICPGDSVCFSFKDSSLSPIVSVRWNFGDTASLAADSSHNKNPCHKYNKPGKYTVVLFVQAKNSCTDTAQYHVSVTQPIPNVGVDTFVCYLDSIMLHASGGVTYVWSPPTGLSNSTIANPNASPTIAITYTVIVTDINGCSAEDSLTVGVRQNPVPQLTYTDTVCSGQPDVLTAGGGVKYVWSTGQTTASISPSPINNTTYTVTVIDVHNCSADTSAPVITLPLPVIQTNNDTSICKNDTITLHANGGVKYLWTSTGAFLTNPADSVVKAIIKDTTVYTVTVTDSMGCSNSARVTVNAYPLPNVSAGANDTVCSGTSFRLHGSGAVNYLWGPIPNFFENDNNTVQNPTVEPNPIAGLHSIQFPLTGTDARGCKNYDTVNVSIWFPFKANFIPDTCICLKNCAVLYVKLTVDGDTPKNYIWSPPVAIENPYSATPMVCPIADTIYQGIVYDGKCYADTGHIKICVHPLPTIYSSHDTLILAGGLAILKAYSDSVGTYTWYTDSTIYCTNCAITTVQPDYITTYVVTVTDNVGCRASDSTVVSVFCSDASIFIPNAFTPNHDGRNDTYIIEGKGFTLKDLSIFDRWGMKVFETHDITQGWDGTYKGEHEGPEVFVYYLEAICSTGEVISKKGNITLIR